MPVPRKLRDRPPRPEPAPTSSRRKPAQVKDDEKKKRDRQKAAQNEQEKALGTLASKEAQIIRKEIEDGANADHPPSRGPQEKVPRPRPQGPALASASKAEPPEATQAAIHGKGSGDNMDVDDINSEEEDLSLVTKDGKKRGASRQLVHEIRALEVDPPAATGNSKRKATSTG